MDIEAYWQWQSEGEERITAHLQAAASEARDMWAGDPYWCDFLDGLLYPIVKALSANNTPTPQWSRYQKRDISHGLQKRVFERDAYRCVHCGTWLDLTVDHIIPESKGGTLDLDNLQTLCKSCNSRKGVR